MKWTPETVAAVNWKEKSAYETLDASAEKWREGIDAGYHSVHALLGVLRIYMSPSCPACQKWYTGANCGDCPLRGSTGASESCCNNLWHKATAKDGCLAVLHFIEQKRDEFKPQEEWEDCTEECIGDLCKTFNYGSNGNWHWVFPFKGIYRHNMPVIPVPANQLKDDVRVVISPTNPYEFRIECRVNREEVEKREFQVRDKVRIKDDIPWDGREGWIVAKNLHGYTYTIFNPSWTDGHDGKTPPKEGGNVSTFPCSHFFANKGDIELVEAAK